MGYRNHIMLALLGGAVLAQPAHATTPFDELAPVPAEQLHQMRGGFITPGGTVVRFGFEQSMSVNNVLQQRVVVQPIMVTPNVPSINVTHEYRDSSNALVSTQQQVNVGDLASSPLQFTNIVNGGLTSLNTTFGPNGNMTVVQNRADGQLIQRASTFNFDISGMRAQLANRAGINSMLQNMRTRSVFGR